MPGYSHQFRTEKDIWEDRRFENLTQVWLGPSLGYFTYFSRYSVGVLPVYFLKTCEK